MNDHFTGFRNNLTIKKIDVYLKIFKPIARVIHRSHLNILFREKVTKMESVNIRTIKGDLVCLNYLFLFKTNQKHPEYFENNKNIDNQSLSLLKIITKQLPEFFNR